ncbi:Fc.00g022430.m01.CDS01 [Cosmosporella sp. VM-42]
MPHGANSVTAVPDQPRKSLELEVLDNCSGNLPFTRSITATSSKSFDMTMSPVIVVTIRTGSGSNMQAILKLYDRRFGTALQSIQGKHAPHASADEAVSQSFVQ